MMDEERKKSTSTENLPPGFRFHPTDEELIMYYLKNKISDSNFTGRAIADVDLNRCEPWDLPGKAKMGEKEWYFFNLRDRKYPTGVRTNRATSSGYWKTTGKDKEIFNTVSMELVGMKKTLVFYKGRAPRGEKTNWVIHEYRNSLSKFTFKPYKDEWVVCRVFKKNSVRKKYLSNSLDQSDSHRSVVDPIDTFMALQMGNKNNNQGDSYCINYMVNGTSMTTETRVLRGDSNPSQVTTTMTNPNPLFQQTNFSGALNLNLGATRAISQQFFAQPQSITMGHCGSILEYSSNNYGHGNDGDSSNNNKIQAAATMESCMALDSYWSTY